MALSAIFSLLFISVLVATPMTWMARQHFISQEVRDEYLSVLRAIRWWMIPSSLLTLALVIVAYAALDTVPYLNFGWWTLISGKSGNIAFGGTDLGDKAGWAGPLFAVIAVVLPIIIVALIPTLALSEEQAYREGSEKLTPLENLVRQIKFGLMHSLFMGIPISAGLALTIGGLHFMFVYKHFHKNSEVWKTTEELIASGVWQTVSNNRLTNWMAQKDGCIASAAAHAVQNYLVLVAMVFVFLALKLLVG